MKTYEILEEIRGEEFTINEGYRNEKDAKYDAMKWALNMQTNIRVRDNSGNLIASYGVRGGN